MSDASKVLTLVGGGVFRGPTSSTAPSGTSGAPTGMVDLGYISEDGIEITIPGAGEATTIKDMTGGSVRVLRKPSEDNPSWHFTMLETSKETVEAYFGVTVTQAASEGSFEYTVTNRGHFSYVVDVIDGAELIRDYIPYGVVVEVGAQTLANGEPIGYEITVEGERGHPSEDYNFARWATALKS